MVCSKFVSNLLIILVVFTLIVQSLNRYVCMLQRFSLCEKYCIFLTDCEIKCFQNVVEIA